MDDEDSLHQLLGLVHYREKRKDVYEERDGYRQALVDITKAATVGEMLDIAHRILSENKS
jgi:hypothetical protein